MSLYTFIQNAAPMAIDNTDIALLHTFFSGPVTEHELACLQQWLKKSPAHLDYFEWLTMQDLLWLQNISYSPQYTMVS